MRSFSALPYAVRCATCGSNDSTAEISVKFLFVTTVRVWVVFSHWPCAHASFVHIYGRLCV